MESVPMTEEVDLKTKHETVVSSGQAALRALFTLNGGATIAFLTFLGHLWDKSQLPLKGGDALVSALQLFIFGSFLAAFAYGAIFFTNCLSLVRWVRSRRLMFGITVFLGFASMACFFAASWQAVHGFESVSQLISTPGK
ncbi:MAG: hypothetical protein QOK37_19 [Thermoanaerobaculia bacterium]|jgi:hypothetical protein|nr:hypothetical protein [Thermoanaerobaculia bacterium]